MMSGICALQFLQCKLTLRKERGDKANFFAFADTLTTKVRSTASDWLALVSEAAPYPCCTPLLYISGV